jgi:short-subunit dehydrogenase involved in D-alanine esterification of teichoic acids
MEPKRFLITGGSQGIGASLAMHPRAFWPELSVFATNPWKEES